MTRTARRGSSGRSLPATPWGYLKRRFSSRYKTLEDKDEECLSDDITPEDRMALEDPNCSLTAKKDKSDLKETHKTKLSGSSMKRFFQNIKQKLSGRKLRRQLKQAEMTPLLAEPGTSKEPVNAKNKKLLHSKRMKRRGNSKRVKEENIQLLEAEKNSENDSDDMDGVVNDRGSAFEGEVTCSLRWRRNKLQFDGDSELVEIVDEKRMKRIESRRRRRQRGKLCFNCRQSGHLIHECPQSESSETGICFKCGAGDHTSKNCRANVASNEYPYAKCFICDEVGHLSRSCPHNPRGMYPQGGGCKVCGSVEHLKANCPERMGKTNQYESWGGASLVIGNDSVDAEDYRMESTSASTNTTWKRTQSHKVVHF